jgi:hypothetical protein
MGKVTPLSSSPASRQCEARSNEAVSRLMSLGRFVRQEIASALRASQ